MLAIPRTEAFYGPGQSLEAVATFGASTNHHVGFGVDLAFTARWAIFSTKNTTNTLFARTHDGSSAVDANLGTGWLGVPHRYRIDWNEASIDFYIDGALVHSQPVTIGDPMRPIASDSAGGLRRRRQHRLPRRHRVPRRRLDHREPRVQRRHQQRR